MPTSRDSSMQWLPSRPRCSRSNCSIDLLAIEREFGRDRSRTPAKGPRTLDLDLLLMGDCILNEERLTLPHPEIATRRFVLAPLAEIAAEAVHPVLGKTISTLLKELRDEGQNRVAAVNIS